MTEQKVFPHRLSLNERKELTVTGVTEVVSFDEETVVMKTSLGTLTVHGRQLQLKNLSTNGGQVEVSGTVSALIYQQNKPTGSWVRRFFG
jgi:sporulation protein YabP